MPRVAVSDAATPQEHHHHHHKKHHHHHHHHLTDPAPPGSVETEADSPDSPARGVVEGGGKRYHGRAVAHAHPEDRHAGHKRIKDAHAAPAAPPKAPAAARATAALRGTLAFFARRSSKYETVKVKEKKKIGADADANFLKVEGHERKHMAGASKKREKRHPENRPENQVIKVNHVADDLLALQLKQKEKEWYDTNRPEVAAQREAEARPKAHKLTFRRTMAMRDRSVVYNKTLSVVFGNDFTMEKAFKKYARNHPESGRKVLFRKEAIKFFTKLNGIPPPADALDYIDVDDGLYVDDGNLKYKVEDYDSYMKNRNEIRARHRLWIDRYKHFASDGVAFHMAEVQKMVVELCRHPFDEDAYDTGRAACQCDTPDKDLQVHDAHKFVLAYERRMRANQREHDIKARNSCARALCRCLMCRPI